MPKATELDQEKHFPVDVLREAAALGMAGIYVRYDFGGSGLSRLDATLIFEALATGCPSIAAYISIHNMSTWMIDRFGDEAQRASWIPKLCTMENLAPYCLTEPGAGSDAAALRMRAVKDGDAYGLNGVKQFFPAPGPPTHMWSWREPRTPAPKAFRPLWSREGRRAIGVNEKKMGWSAQSTRQVILEDARIPAGNLLASEAEGFKIAMAGPVPGRPTNRRRADRA